MSRRLPVLSDRSLAELVAGRLRERGVFSLFVRALGPHQGVFISATGFDQAGALQRVYGEQASLEAALVSLLAELDKPQRVRQPPPRPPVAPARSMARAAYVVPERPPAEPEEDDSKLRRRAMELVARQGAVTVTSLLQARAIPPADHKSFAVHRAFLEQLVAEGTLRRSARLGYVAADAPAEVDRFPADERERADLEEP